MGDASIDELSKVFLITQQYRKNLVTLNAEVSCAYSFLTRLG